MSADSALLRLPSLDVAPPGPLPPGQLLRVGLSALLDGLDRGDRPTSGFAAAFRALEALPLATDEYQRSRASLRNARAYLEADEPGASRFELNALFRRLPKLLRDVP